MDSQQCEYNYCHRAVHLRNGLKSSFYIMYTLLCRGEENSSFFYTSRLSGWSLGNSNDVKTDEQEKYSLLACAAHTLMERSSIIYRLLLLYSDSFAKVFHVQEDS